MTKYRSSQTVKTLIYLVLLFAFAKFDSSAVDPNNPPKCPNMWACIPCGNPPAPGPAGGGGSGGKTGANSNDFSFSHGMPGGVGGPIDLTRGCAYEDVTDFSLPVKHGLSLEVRRLYSDKYMFMANKNGDTALGYSQSAPANANESVNSNWHLYLWESRVLRIPAPSTSAQYDPNMLLYIDKNGNFIHFGYASTSTSPYYNDELKLLCPSDRNELNQYPPYFVSIYYPIGSDQFPNGNNMKNEYRQTTKDLTMYVIHFSMSSDTDITRLDNFGSSYLEYSNVKGFVLRNSNGEQLHYYGLGRENGSSSDSDCPVFSLNGGSITPAGLLHYVDANWRNNHPDLQSVSSDNIDDYLKVEWTLGQNPNNGKYLPVINKVYAPPSDGRRLLFNHPGGGYGVPPYSYIDGVILYNGPDETNGYQPANYSYLDDPSNPSNGKLHRVSYGSNLLSGVQYDYGHLNGAYDSTNQCVTLPLDSSSQEPVLDPSSTLAPYLAVISEFSESGVRGVQANVRTFDQNGCTNVTQWVRDTQIPSPPDLPFWRAAFNLDYNGIGKGGGVKYLSGMKLDGTGKYNTDDTYSYTNFNYHHVITGYNLTTQNPVQRVKDVYYTETHNATPDDPQDPGAFNLTTRLLQKRMVFVGSDPSYYNLANDNLWVMLDEYEYQDTASGINKPTTVKHYADYQLNSSGVYENNNSTVQSTEYIYEDSNNPDAPSAINYPDGSRVEMTYDWDGKILTLTNLQYNTASSAYQTISTTNYVYNQWGTTAGLLDHVTVTPSSGPAHSTYYAYNERGMITSVNQDGKTTAYSDFDDFGNPAHVATVAGTTNFTYSSDVPPRLQIVEDPSGSKTSYGYDEFGRKTTVTVAYDTTLFKTTQYQYDNQSNLAKVTDSDSKETQYVYDIYGKMIKLIDAGGSATQYTYDAWGRLVKEEAMNSDQSAVTRRVDYSYVSGSSSGGCGSCGGGQDKLASRQVTCPGHTADNSLISYRYDLLGRMIAQSSVSGADDYCYYYLGTRLDHIIHRANSSFSLWGNGQLVYQYDDMGRLWREVFPNHRYIEYNYDDGGRLVSVKDPYGFINKVDYDDSDPGNQYAHHGRLKWLTHSALGKAELAYYDPTYDFLNRLTLGNGAFTEYQYDSHKRLNQFEYHQPGATGYFQKHNWDYDDLGRKTAISVAIPSMWTGTGSLTPTYDNETGGRLTREILKNGSQATLWDVQYGYDGVGNRTSYNPGTGVTLGYNQFGTNKPGQNEEVSVNNSANNALQYNGRGDVTSRTPLGGGAAYTYTWDAYERLRSSAHSGSASVNYDYDAMGRLVKRSATTGGATQITANYWLGLNKLAEERWIDSNGGKTVFSPDSESAADPAGNGWIIFRSVNGGTLEYVNDAVTAEPARGRVLHFGSGSAAALSGCALIGNAVRSGNDDNDNPNSGRWGKTGYSRVGLWLRNADPNHEAVRIGVLVSHFDLNGQVDGQRNLNFITSSATPPADSGGCRYINLVGGSGSDYTDFNDGKWHYVELDVSGNAPWSSSWAINGLVFKGSEIYVDDIVLANAALEKASQLNPMSVLGGCLGSWKSSSSNQAGLVYYHYNEMGTVLSTTDKSGSIINICEPDYFGNYRYVVDALHMPDIGLTGKFLDSDSGLYYFNARWYDRERGSFLSHTSHSPVVEHQYGFNVADPVNYVDIDGNKPNHWDWWNPFDDISYGFDWVLDKGFDAANMVGLHPEDWGSSKGDWFHCFAKCLECNNAANPYAGIGAYLGGGAQWPKAWMNEKIYNNADRVGSLFHKWKGRPGFIKRYGNFIKGRPWKWGKAFGSTSSALFIGEGMWALAVETKCMAECSGDTNSY